MTEKREVDKFNFKFENTYIDLPNSFYSEINLWLSTRCSSLSNGV